MHPWKILCDFDGTVSIPDATDALLEQYARPEWKDLERQWHEGAIGSRDCMSRQVGLIEASEREIDRVCDGIPIDPAFPQFVEHARRLGLELVIVSDGLDRIIHRILANNRLDGLTVIANHLVQAGPRNWEMQSPHANHACVVKSGTCKCACAAHSIAAGNKVLLIGDGQSDVCVAARADFVFAKRRLLAHCQDEGIAHQPFDDFSDVLAMLPDLVQGMFDRNPLPPPSPGHRTEYA
ncbi:MtnX-like HAD-IB family phosphatase [Cognatiluteimonas profundi]|uniref:MtnX-like HAD-IB family phosphatase n=1 Tax=Cognatiluteimonas profundi TaxID=2594501 RepID=UPI00131E7D80|nr:MtnX-like HAD-IB family phosphatase [Lysobacter profundi]